MDFMCGESRIVRKKGMSVGMIFGIIFAILVMSMILVFGADVTKIIFCTGNDAQIQKTIDNLQSVMDDLYMLPSGSGDWFTIKIPSDFRICFVNSTDPGPVIYPQQERSWKPDIVYQRIIQDEGYNIWFRHCSGESGGEIEHLFISPGKNFCAKTGTRIYLESTGRWVTISE